MRGSDTDRAVVKDAHRFVHCIVRGRDRPLAIAGLRLDREGGLGHKNADGFDRVEGRWFDRNDLLLDE